MGKANVTIKLISGIKSEFKKLDWTSIQKGPVHLRGEPEDEYQRYTKEFEYDEHAGQVMGRACDEVISLGYFVSNDEPYIGKRCIGYIALERNTSFRQYIYR